MKKFLLYSFIISIQAAEYEPDAPAHVYQLSLDKVLVGHADGVNVVKCSLVARSLCNVVASGAKNNHVRLWDISTGKCTQTLCGHTDAITAIEFLGNHSLITGSQDKACRIWDIATGQCTKVQHLHEPIRGITSSPDGRHYAIALKPQQIVGKDPFQLLRVFCGDTLRFKSQTIKANILYMKITNDMVLNYDCRETQLHTYGSSVITAQGTSFLTNRSPIIEQFDHGSNQKIQEFILPEDKQACVITTTPYEQFIVTGCTDGHLYVLDAKTGNIIAAEQAFDHTVSSVACAADNSHLIAASSEENDIKVYQIK